LVSLSKATPRRRGWFLLNTVVPTAPIQLCCSWWPTRWAGAAQCRSSTSRERWVF